MDCPKCHSRARDTAQFCPKCHAPLRYRCPKCGHQQEHGGTCDSCGLDFLKYVSATMAVQQMRAEKARDQNRKRSGLLRGVLLLPVDMGFSLVRSLLAGLRGRSPS